MVIRLIKFVLFSLVMLTFIGLGGAFAVYWYYGRDLPDTQQLAHYQPSITTRVYAGDGRLMAEYATEKRVFIPLSAMPPQIIQAFLSAEDKGFYNHFGIDPSGIGRALLTNLRNMGQDKRPSGASTITQQVAKNFLLSNTVSVERKVKEMILAFRIEQAFSKNHILELYLNEIFLGNRSYGVGAAALNYFDKSLDELSISEAAFLAALPKAPNNYNPVRNPENAKERRDWVIDRMLQDGHISAHEAEFAKKDPIQLSQRPDTELVRGVDYFAEDIRRELAARYGEDALYKGGLSVNATINPTLQALADKALRGGLIDYDRRHGWRGSLARISVGEGWAERLAAQSIPPALPPWQLAVVLDVDKNDTTIGLADGSQGIIPFSAMKWARPWQEGQRVGNPPRRPADVVAVGDVIPVSRLEIKDGAKVTPVAQFALEQIPKIEGALVALDPNTGRILALSGGYSFARSEFNRASQAMRQPGSAFKPFVYLTALEKGYTPSSLILDAPVVLDQGPGLPKWKPVNYSRDFLGPTTLRMGVEKSKNLMTVRLAQAIGMPAIVETTRLFGINENLTPVLAMSLGAGETTVLRLTAAYGMLANGGKKVTPTLIDRVQDRSGKTIYKHDQRPCDGCNATFYANQDIPAIPDNREAVADPMSAYQMVSILQGVTVRGTAGRLAALNLPLAGKTGTSNNSMDTWFVGFSPDLAVGVFVGFDEPATLGGRETGGSAALPIFQDFIKEALKDKAPGTFRIPPGMHLVRVDYQTGRMAQGGEGRVIVEAFKPGTEPTGDEGVLDGGEMWYGDDVLVGGFSNDEEGGPPIPAASKTAPTSGGLY